MAKWINFHVTGGYDNTGAVPAEDGDNLLLADSILAIAVAANGAGDAMSATLTLASKTVTVLFSLDAEATDPGAANPGGVKSSVVLPQDVADVNAAYDASKRVYFKSFKIA